MNADAYLSPYGIAINPVGGMFGDGTIDGAGVASVGSERGGLTACRGFDNNTITGKPLASGPLGGAYGSFSGWLQ